MLSRRYVEAPAGAPLPFGLLSAAVVVDDNDPHLGMGVEYESLSCGTAHLTAAACFTEASEAGGTISVSVDAARTATLTVDGTRGTATITWGDGTTVTDDTPSGQTHTYTADGTYTVTVTDTYGYRATVEVDVTNLATSGPFEAGSGTGFTVSDDGMGELVGGDPFTVYALHQCRAPGSVSRASETARGKLTNGEGRAIEEAFAQRFADATDLTPTPGTAVDPVAGLAILEQYAAENYGGVPTIHATRDTGTILGSRQVIERVGGRLETKLGAIVAAGGGYSTAGTVGATTAADGERWLVVTGTVVVRRGSVGSTDPMLARGAGNEPTNEYQVLAHRNVVVTSECLLAAVLVQAPVEATA